jgi:hypothetical protein
MNWHIAIFWPYSMRGIVRKRSRVEHQELLGCRAGGLCGPAGEEAHGGLGTRGAGAGIHHVGDALSHALSATIKNRTLCVLWGCCFFS